MKTNMRFLPVFLAIIVVQAFALGGQRVPEKISFDSVTISQPYVALTFTDGPSSMLTPQVLKILADRNVKATFFVTGENALSHPDIVKQEIAAGHEVGSRSWSHSIFSDVSDTQLLSDLQRTDQAIKAATGNSPRFFSPFDTTFTDVQCDTVNKQFGYTVIFWSVDSLAVKDKGAAAIANTIITQAKPGSIIMSSDINSSSIQALPVVIDTLVSKGYKFVTVPELIAISTSKKFRPAGATYATRPASPPDTTYSPAPSTSSSTTTPGGFHPFGVESPGGGTTVADPSAPNASQ
jgi:peptidoglycan-N-acetylglucosamine deacetylase